MTIGIPGDNPYGFFQLKSRWWLGTLEQYHQGPMQRNAVISARDIRGEYIRLSVPEANWAAAADLYLQVVADPQSNAELYRLIQARDGEDTWDKC